MRLRDGAKILNFALPYPIVDSREALILAEIMYWTVWTSSVSHAIKESLEEQPCEKSSSSE